MSSELEQHSPNRPHSIDLTLELERELDNEASPPNSPGVSNRPQSLDASVLASIVTQLRFSLEEVTKERDGLVELLDKSTRKQADLQDNLQLMTDRSSSLEDQLSAAQDKHREDEEAISMLRAKVEESRRGLMRLQTESRRQSQLTIDSARAAPSKRMSLISPLPLTPNPNPNRSHRRFSSQSDASLNLADASELSQIPSPIVESPPANNHRFSMLTATNRSPSPSEQETKVLAKEMDGLRKELKNVRDEMEETRHELTEANEARDASEQCAKALRDFISENAVGVTGAPAPQPPASLLIPTTSKAEDPKSATKWGFKLWNSATTPVDASSVVSPVSNRSSSGSAISQSASSPPLLSKKLGSFFGSRGSISSISSTSSQPAPIPPVPSLPSMYRGGSSDTSSAGEEEPRSPDLDSLVEVAVRENSNSSELAELALPVQGKDDIYRNSTPTATSVVATAF